MTEELKNNCYAQNMVIVQNGSFSEKSKCNVRNCKKHQKHLVFVGASPRLSTLYSSCCPNHLSLTVNKAVESGKERALQMIKRYEEKEISDAKNLLKK